MTQDAAARLHELSEAADPGPWSWDGIGGGRLRTPTRAIADLRYSHNAANADLIVAAVNYVRELLAQLPRAERGSERGEIDVERLAEAMCEAQLWCDRTEGTDWRERDPFKDRASAVEAHGAAARAIAAEYARLKPRETDGPMIAVEEALTGDVLFAWHLVTQPATPIPAGWNVVGVAQLSAPSSETP